MMNGSKRKRVVVLSGLLIVALSVSSDTSAASPQRAWRYEADLEVNTLFPAVCASRDGRVLIPTEPESRESTARASIVSRDGAGEIREFPALPGAGRVRKALACHWLGDSTLMVLVRTDREERGALWLDDAFKVTGWRALDDKTGDTTPTAIAEVAEGQFVTVGVRLLHPTAVRFDRQAAARLDLPWVDGAEGMLRDVVATGQNGGFAACGVEVRRQGASVVPEIVMAVFDGVGKARADTRLKGRSCGFLPMSGGHLRMLHDDGTSEQIGLMLTTFDDALEAVSSEKLMRDYAPGMSMLAFELGDRILVASPRFAGETLEIFGPSGRESVPLGIDPGGMVDILPGPARVYVVSAPKRMERREGEGPFGVRVEAYDMSSPAP
jgi:hypothetical protein